MTKGNAIAVFVVGTIIIGILLRALTSLETWVCYFVAAVITIFGAWTGEEIWGAAYAKGKKDQHEKEYLENLENREDKDH